MKDGIIDRNCAIKDVEFPYTRWLVLQYWFGNKNSKTLSVTLGDWIWES